MLYNNYTETNKLFQKKGVGTMLRPAIHKANKPSLFTHDFDSFFDNMFQDFWGNELSVVNSFKTDVIDQGDSYLLKAELPGFQKEDIHIDLANDTLTITASTDENLDENKDNYIRKERHYRSFARSFHVENMQTEDIDASYNNGILDIKLPKKEVEKKEENKRIEIK